MRQKPVLDYSGLTVVLSNPSRFDKERGRLITGTAGDIFNDQIDNWMTRARVDVRTLDSMTEGLLPHTKCILFMGKKTLQFAGVEHTLNECRGSVFRYQNIPCIFTYLPQDAVDPMDYEGKHNPLADAYDDKLDEDKTDNEKSSHGKTSRQNWMFWFKSDVAKAARITANGVRPLVDYRTDIFPNSKLITNLLTETKNDYLFIDIETDIECNITCVGVCFSEGPTYVIPFIRHDYRLAYGVKEFCRIYRALAIALNNNTIVAHNSMFDLFVLGYKYRIPFGKHVYDTMLAHHRCFPEIEKSLGHCVAFWLDETYHKNDGVFMPNNQRQEQALWEYNAKDIATMRSIKTRIDQYATGILGLSESIAAANSMVRPYLINTMQGIRYDQEQVDKIRRQNALRMTEYLRILKILTGKDINPNSNKDVPEYFFKDLEYPVLKRSDKTGAASCGSGDLYKMKLKFPDNAAIDTILAFRKLKKENGMLKFNPWKE